MYQIIKFWSLHMKTTLATKSCVLSREPPTACRFCGQTLTICSWSVHCYRNEYYTVDSLNSLFETIYETCIVEFPWETGLFYLIWCNLLTSTSPQTWTIWFDLSKLFREWMKATLRHIYLCRVANMSWRTCAVVKTQSNINTWWVMYNKYISITIVASGNKSCALKSYPLTW